MASGGDGKGSKVEEQIMASGTVPLQRAELLAAFRDLRREGDWEK